jgi:hypothetical protein
MGDNGEGCTERAGGPNDEEGGNSKVLEGGGSSTRTTVNVRHWQKSGEIGGEQGLWSDWRTTHMAGAWWDDFITQG